MVTGADDSKQTRVRMRARITAALAGLVVSLLAACSRHPDSTPDHSGVPPRLPDSTPRAGDPPSAAWAAAGFQVGFVSVDGVDGSIVFQVGPGPADLLAFQSAIGSRPNLRGLPDPGRSFGLRLGSGAELSELPGLRSLQVLDLSECPATDVDLRYLAGLTDLQALEVTGGAVTDAGLRPLAGLKRLRSLRLYETAVTGSGLKDLAGLEDLRVLSLSHSAITDEGLRAVSDLAHLRSLRLPDTGVTDAGLPALAGLRELRSLDLSRTRVTDAGVEPLQRSLPKCDVLR